LNVKERVEPHLNSYLHHMPISS